MSDSRAISVVPMSPLAALKSTASAYYRLTKPGIVYSNVMTAAAGYLFASQWNSSLTTLLSLLVGTGLLIAASCVLNNYIDRKIDAKMSRTRKRALVTGTVTKPRALLYAAVLILVGFVVLANTNRLTVAVGALAVVSYVVVYGVAKRRSVHGTLVGTIPGAAALVAGYTAVMNRLDWAALVLFLIMVVWQMVHFYAIAIFRHDDYAAAGIPVRPVVYGTANVRRHMIVYVILFCLVAPLLTLTGQIGYCYALAMVLLGLSWVRVVLGRHDNDVRWARKTFGHSLLVLLGFSILLSVGVLLP